MKGKFIVLKGRTAAASPPRLNCFTIICWNRAATWYSRASRAARPRRKRSAKSCWSRGWESWLTPSAPELLAVEASRAQHTQEKIIPALEAGKVVICERYTMSTCAYQGYGRGIDLNTIRTLNDIATLGTRPDLTLESLMSDKYFTDERRIPVFRPAGTGRPGLPPENAQRIQRADCANRQRLFD